MTRVVLFQTDAWSASLARGNDPYALDRCCHCHAPVTRHAKRIRVTRTDDGEWWVVAPDAPVADDEHDFGPRVTLPVGVTCLAAHPAFRIGLTEAPLGPVTAWPIETHCPGGSS